MKQVSGSPQSASDQLARSYLYIELDPAFAEL